MGYVNSSNIRIFPTSSRSTNSGTNWVTENNLASILRSILSSNKSFVISDAGESPFKFVINGYYVEVNGWDDLENNLSNGSNNSCTLINFVKDDKKITAQITIIKNNSDESFQYLDGGDNKDLVGGGTLIPAEPFVLAEYSGDAWKVPDTSRLNLVKLLLNDAFISEEGTITNKGTIEGGSLSKVKLTGGTDNDDNIISKGSLQGVDIGPKDSVPSKFTGTLNDTILDGTLIVKAGKTIKPQEDSEGHTVNDETRIVATRIRGGANKILKPKNITDVDQDYPYTTNLAELFILDDGEL